ncbi:MAG: efflux RND transporter periplasmic adaptor subunit [Planctomycetia bacterium]|nr:efflux RND transporter periplasmic adaptor subunit [Planctomycetia bacterium]
MTTRKVILLAFLLIGLALAITVHQYWDVIKAKFDSPLQALQLPGNVDDRQINLAFQIPERVAQIEVEEGDFVRKGDLLGTLETVRIENRIAEAEAAVQAAQAKHEKEVNGYRPEEIEMAKAGVDIIKAQIQAAENRFKRSQKLATISAVSEQDAEDAEANYNKLLAQLDLATNNLNKMLAGTRKEDIAMAQANVTQAEAQLNIQRQNLADTQLKSPCDGIIRNRILEPGEMASPQSTALILAVVSPKWIRVYVSEPLLPKIKPGDKAVVTLDGLPDTPLDGWVGFISPNAEFTPKNVETKELRTSLVYEVRVFVNDSDNILKLGAPVVVIFPDIMDQP